MSTAKPVVAFLGPVGSYSHQAALNCFSPRDHELIATAAIQDIFEEVQSGRAERGVVPFENSTNGSVVFTLDLLADRKHAFADIYICGETYVHVQHNLLGYFPPDAPVPDRDVAALSVSTTTISPPQSTPHGSGANTPTASSPFPVPPRSRPRCSLKHIQRIYSHPQAFGQCELFLGAYLKGVERIHAGSTSRAATLAKEDTTGSSAAIASTIAADINHIDFLARGIEDAEDNRTRFFVIRKGPPAPSETNGVNGHDAAATASAKSLITFSLDHTQPGALADVLECFRAHQLNLTSINSRPSHVATFQYIFIVEFRGDRYHDADGRVAKALDGVAAAARTWRFFGSWHDRMPVP